MSNKHIVEALLRPPVELYTATICWLSAAIIWLSPWHLMAPIQISQGVAIGCVLFGSHRAWQAYLVLRYQHLLRRVPRYRLGEDEIPVSQTHLFIGKGFLWEQQHTQRIYDIRSTEGHVYIKRSRLSIFIERKRIEWQNRVFLYALLRFITVDIPFNPFRPLPEIGGAPYVHGVGAQDEESIYLSLRSRKQHVLVIGPSGVGKTRFAQICITQDIRRKNNCVIVLDPKGDSELLLTVYQEAKAANRPFYMFHLGFPEFSCRYNFSGVVSHELLKSPPD